MLPVVRDAVVSRGTMRVLTPRSGDVLEHGSVCVLRAEEFSPHERVTVSIADARSWSGRWWRQIDTTRAGNDGMVNVRWHVPKDLPVADAYVVRFAGAGSVSASAGTGTDNTKPKSSSISGKQSDKNQCEVSNVKVTSPLKVTRVGRDLVEISWSPSALPTEQSGRDGWRLAVDVLPVLHVDEYHADVVGDLFLRAAADGNSVHTRKKSVLFDVARDEAGRRKKSIRLTPCRTYRIALAGFTVGELEAVFSTSRADVIMSLVQLSAVGGGYSSGNGGARLVSLGHAEHKRIVAKDTATCSSVTMPPSTPEITGAQGPTSSVDSLPVPSPMNTPGASIPTVAVNKLVPGLIPSSDDVDDLFPETAPSTPLGTSPANGPLPPQPKSGSFSGINGLNQAQNSPPKVPPEQPLGAWETSNKGDRVFQSDRGVNIVVVSASDLQVVYDKTWDLSGGRRAETARAACSSFQKVFTKGELRVGSTKRKKWGAHFVCVTTSGVWCMAPGKDGDDYGVAVAIDAVLETLGTSRNTRSLSKHATHVAGQPAGVAILAACGPGGAERRSWAHFGSSPKDRAKVTICLAQGAGADGVECDLDDNATDDSWFPFLVRGGVGSGASVAVGDWRAPWSAWGKEPWGGVAQWAAEETRVGRYLRLVHDTHARTVFLGVSSRSIPSDKHISKRSTRVIGITLDTSDDANGTLTSGSPGFAAVGPETFDDGSGDESLSNKNKTGRVERGDGSYDGSGGRMTDASNSDMDGSNAKASSSSTFNRVEVFGIAKALLEYATTKFSAASWPSNSKIKAKYRTITDEELTLVFAAEQLVTDIAQGGSAFAAAELVNAGAAEFLSKRICSLLSADGDFVDASDASNNTSMNKNLITETKTLATALAQLLMRNGSACLAEATRREPACVEAVVRVFLGSWRGNLGQHTVPEIEHCVETLADANIRVEQIEVFGKGMNCDVEMVPSPTTKTSIRVVRAGFTQLPSTRSSSSLSSLSRTGGGRNASVKSPDAVSGKVCFLDVPSPDPKRSGVPLALPHASRFFSKRSGQESSASTEHETHDTSHDTSRDEDDAAMDRSWGSDASGDEAVTLDEIDIDEKDAHGVIHDRGTSNVSLAGAVAVFRACGGAWSAHSHMIRQAPRLTYMAQAAGAVAVVFLWPDRSPKYPPTQALLPSPNFDTPTRIPAFTAPASAFAEAGRSISIENTSTNGLWDARLRVGSLDDEGSAVKIAQRCGAVLTRAMSLRPSPEAAQAAHRASRGAGRVYGLHWLKRARDEKEKREREKSKKSIDRANSERKSTVSDVDITGNDTEKQKGSAKPLSTTDNETSWSWGGSLKYLGIKTNATDAKPNQDVSVDDGHALMDMDQGTAHNPITDSMMESESRDSKASPNIRFSQSEASMSRRWSCATRIAYALGELGKPLLDMSYPQTNASGDDQSTSSSNTSPVRILCLDGGGIRGLATIVMLRKILQASDAWCVGECFDLVIGTSTGGVIALGAGLLRLTLDEVGDLYDTMASEVFKPDGYYDLLRKGPGHAAAKSFEKVMSDMLGPEANAPLYHAAAHPRWYAASDKCRPGGPPRVCLITSLVSRQPSTLVLLRSYHRGNNSSSTGTTNTSSQPSSRSGELPGEHRMSAVDALRATTAAPWYMEELALDKELGFGKTKRHVEDVMGDGGDTNQVNASDVAAHSDGNLNSTNVSHRFEDHDAHGVVASNENTSSQEAKTSARDASRVETNLRYIDGAIACNNPTSVGIFEARRLFGKQRPLCVVSLGTGAAVPCETKTRGQDIGNVMGNLVNATCDVVQVDTLARNLLNEEDIYFRFQPVDDIFGCELNDSREVTRTALRDAARRYMELDTVKHEVEELATVLMRE